MVKSVFLSKSDWISLFLELFLKFQKSLRGGMMRKAPSKAYECYPEKKIFAHTIRL